MFKCPAQVEETSHHETQLKPCTMYTDCLNMLELMRSLYEYDLVKVVADVGAQLTFSAVEWERGPRRQCQTASINSSIRE